LIGSLKESQQTLYEKAGNDFDLSSLLIALLRVSGIKARYVYGEIIVPIDRVKGWLGVNDPWVAGNILATSGIPARMLIVDGRPWGIRLEHCWVEAYIPYEGSKVYRGAYDPKDIGRARWMWVPMDVSYKEYEIPDIFDPFRDISYDTRSVFEEILSSGRIDTSGSIISVTSLDTALIRTKFIEFANEVKEYLEENHPNASLMDVFGMKRIKKESFGFIPRAFPYKVVSVIGRFDEIPADKRYVVKIQVKTSYQDIIFSYSFTTVDALSKRITLSYIPAGEEDEEIIDSYGSLIKTPPYLVNLKPVLRIEGEVVREGDAIKGGEPDVLDVVFESPSGYSEVVSNEVIAGAYYALGIVGQKVSNEYLRLRGYKFREAKLKRMAGEEVEEDDYVGEYLYYSALSYFFQKDFWEFMNAQMMKIVRVKDVSMAIVTADVDIDYLFNVPYKWKLAGLTIDVDRDIVSAFHRDGESGKEISFNLFKGGNSSGVEYDVIQQMTFIHSVSAISILREANLNGMPIYGITRENMDITLSRLEVSDEIKNRIVDFINAGKVVLVPEGNIHLNNWEGTCYIVVDLETGGGGFHISGGLSGGSGSLLLDCVSGLFALIDLMPLPFPGRWIIVGIIIGILAFVFATTDILTDPGYSWQDQFLAVMLAAISLWLDVLAFKVLTGCEGISCAVVMYSVFFILESLVLAALDFQLYDKPMPEFWEDCLEWWRSLTGGE